MKGLLCVLLALPAGKYSLLCTLCFVSLHIGLLLQLPCTLCFVSLHHWSSSAVIVHFVFCVVKLFVFFCSYCALCVLYRQTIGLLQRLLCTLCVMSKQLVFCTLCVVPKPLVFFCSYWALCVLYVSLQHRSSFAVTVHFVCCA